jgi:hypothetical protein
MERRCDRCEWWQGYIVEAVKRRVKPSPLLSVGTLEGLTWHAINGPRPAPEADVNQGDEGIEQNSNH